MYPIKKRYSIEKKGCFMRDDTTSRLAGILSEISDKKKGEEFIKKYSGDVYAGFADYFRNYIAENDIDIAEAVKKSGISRNYVYQIINGRKNASRDKIIALCIGSRMNFSQINRCLAISGYNPLYPKNERDARIGICINTGIHDVVKVNLVLEEHNLSPLEV